MSMNNIQPLSNNKKNQFAINFINITNFTIQNNQFFDNFISFLLVNEQQLQNNQELYQREAKLIKSSFINNKINLEASLILLNNLDQVTLDNITLKLNKLNQNTLSSFIQVNQCYNIILTECIFQDNINSDGYGGALQLIETQKANIYYSHFISNKCLQKNGGAINFINTKYLGTLDINFSAFVMNQAVLSTGGAINLSKVNLILKNSQIESNKAQIGGGIYYQQIVPDFVIILQKGIKQNNTIQNNYANIYGKNLGSTLRKIYISQKDITIQSSHNINYKQYSLEVDGIQSGEQITYQKIQVLDEEGTPVYIPSIQNQSSLSDDVLLIIRQINIEITCDQLNIEVQCVGNLKSSDYQNGGFYLTVQPMYKPLSTMSMKIRSNVFPQLVDSNNNIQINQGQLDLQVLLNFDQCRIGQIQKQFSNSIICESCPEGKYSLDILDGECKKCPDSAVYCSGSKIQLKNGYWRSNEFTDDIIYCNYNPNVCQPQSNQSKFNCERGYIGIICGSCDIYGQIWDDSYAEYITSKQCYKCSDNIMLIFLNNFLKFFVVIAYIFFMVRSLQKQLYIKLLGHYVKKSGILFLSNTYKSERQKIFSKILNDHLQILSLVYSLFNNFMAISVPVQITGNPLGAISKSIDCLYTTKPNLQPLWFYQLLWSLLQPILIITLYFLIGYIFLKFKQNLFIRHARAALIFIYFYYFVSIITILSKSMNCVQIGDQKYMDLDYNIKCYDPKYHLPYIFIFCLPLLIIYGMIIPIILFVSVYLVRKGKKSFFIKVQYSYIFAGFRDKMYYWEFYKIIYKASLIIIFILLKENNQLIQVLMNIIMSLNIFLVGKAKPYIQQNYNDLQHFSNLICILALNFFYIQQISSQQIQQTVFLIITVLIIILPNIYLFLQLIFGMINIQVNANKADNNLVQNLLLKLKQKYPKKFTNVQIISNQKIRSLLKLKEVQRKFRILLKFLKNYNFYNEEQLLVQFNLESQFINIPSERKELEKLRNSNLNFLTSSIKQEEVNNNLNYLKQISCQSEQVGKTNNNPQCKFIFFFFKLFNQLYPNQKNKCLAIQIQQHLKAMLKIKKIKIYFKKLQSLKANQININLQIIDVQIVNQILIILIFIYIFQLYIIIFFKICIFQTQLNTTKFYYILVVHFKIKNIIFPIYEKKFFMQLKFISLVYIFLIASLFL
ncbi:transmembrane protein, putative (macronuclear) [Tetrahymena thermophila SB210]|uniref:Transmembrane protein, putative n=1 Tax=Tetrahymena thermophila (strain SB210) TaxID=312017 RepID=W7XE83_TETTS|nr:transmembrane protein, putative [Tetrahymena thermophila SB210]EWS71179.1 transmembrane protein, putative [Tetrahymena thermophila SB210]|eukprot:XP_012656277.1 transmembrane protein, putative [Tetrahymena thermophila SB210]